MPSRHVVRAFATTFVVFVTAVTLAGCGGDGGSDAAATDSGTTTGVEPAEVSAGPISGLYPNDTWSGDEVTWTRKRCRGGTLTVALSSDPELFQDDQLVTARVAGGTRRR